MNEIATVAVDLTRMTAPGLVVSVAVFLLLRRISKSVGFALVTALAVAFFIGYAALPEWAPLTPQRHWHWLPYVGMAAAAAGWFATNPSLGVWRHSATLIVLCCAAWLLVPAWPVLAPWRPFIVAALAVYFVALSFVFVALAKRLPSGEVLTYLFLASTAVSICTMAAVSLRSGQVAGVVAASVAGCCIGSWLARVESKDLQALVPCYVVLSGGITFVGFIEPDPPFYELLLIALAAAAALVSQIHPLGQPQGANSAAVRIGLVVAAIAIGCGLALA